MGFPGFQLKRRTDAAQHTKEVDIFERKCMGESGALQKSRVQKQFKNFLKGKTLMEVIPEDVVGFLISKEMEGSGRTLVHKEECKN